MPRASSRSTHVDHVQRRPTTRLSNKENETPDEINADVRKAKVTKARPEKKKKALQDKDSRSLRPIAAENTSSVRSDTPLTPTRETSHQRRRTVEAEKRPKAASYKVYKDRDVAVPEPSIKAHEPDDSFAKIRAEFEAVDAWELDTERVSSPFYSS